MSENNTVTNDILYNEIEAGIDRVKDRIIEELIMSDDELLLDDILDQIQMAIQRAAAQKEIYRSWIYNHEIPEKYIYDPGDEDYIEDENEFDDGNPEDEDY